MQERRRIGRDEIERVTKGSLTQERVKQMGIENRNLQNDENKGKIGPLAA
jgi:hypothetical protein